MGLRLVSDDGEVVSASEDVLAGHVLRLEQEIEDLQKDLTVKRRIITELKRRLKDKAEEHALFPQAEMVFKHWQRAAGHPRSKFGEKRIKATVGRLKDGYSVQQLCKAADGIAYDCEKKLRKNGTYEAYDDLEIAMRSDKNVEKYANRAPRVHK